MSVTKFGINERGFATIVALMVMLMLVIIGVAAIKLADDEINIAGNEINEMSAFYAAEAGLERASAAIQWQYESTGSPPTTMPSGNETINKCNLAYNTTDNGGAEQRVLTQGTLAGLHALVKTYSITSLGSSQVDNSKVNLIQEFECAMVPLFQFAVFYGNDLEIAPGPDMTLLGRVHSNGNLWLQAGSNLYMDSYVTCSGDLLHGRKGPGGVSNGNVYIKDTDGNYQNMMNADGTFLESSDTDWYDSASTRWGGRVQDAAFGQGELNLPLTNTGDPHKLIERASGNADSYENLAELKIIDGSVYAQSGGTWIDVTAHLPVNTVTTSSFYDKREGTWVNSTDIDIDKLAASSYFPSNGVVYSSDERAGTFNALRLTNGADIGSDLTIVSENPMYVQGDYNSVDKKPAALMADAITFLSNNWDDVRSHPDTSLDRRRATETTCNASIMTGNTNTTSSNYNGGLENLPRFLETWKDASGTKTKFKFTGSLINLWNSLQATGDWSYGSYYTAPIREWAYDTDLDDPGKLPPEAPQIRVFQRTRWQQIDIGYAARESDD